MTATAQNAPANPAQDTATEMFWIATVQPAQQRVGEIATFTFKGVYTPQPGSTRRDAFNSIREYISGHLTRIGQPASHNVLFYSLEPNQL